MDLDRPSLISVSLAGTILAAAGLSSVIAEEADDVEPSEVQPLAAATNAWLADLRASFSTGGFSQPLAGILLRMNTMAILGAPDLFPVAERLRFGTPDVDPKSFRIERYATRWWLGRYGEASRVFSDRSLPKSMRSVALNAVVQEVILETRERANLLREQGLRMRPITPIRALSIVVDAPKYEPAQSFGTIFSVSPIGQRVAAQVVCPTPSSERVVPRKRRAKAETSYAAGS